MTQPFALLRRLVPQRDVAIDQSGIDVRYGEASSHMTALSIITSLIRIDAVNVPAARSYRHILDDLVASPTQPEFRESRNMAICGVRVLAPKSAARFMANSEP